MTIPCKYNCFVFELNTRGMPPPHSNYLGINLGLEEPSLKVWIMFHKAVVLKL